MPLIQPRLNSVEEWKFVNHNNDEHPIHVHVNDFQVTNTSIRRPASDRPGQVVRRQRQRAGADHRSTRTVIQPGILIRSGPASTTIPGST